MTRAVPRVVSRAALPAIPAALLAAAALVPLAPFAATDARAQTTGNPFPADIATGDVAVRAVPFSRASSPFGASVRMNDLTSLGDGRSILTDQRGALLSIPSGGGAATPYLNLRTFAGAPGVLDDGGERGVGSAAFHPDFLNAGSAGFGKFYTVQSAPGGSPTAGNAATPTFTAPGGGRTHDEVLLEWTTPTPSAATFGGTVREVLRVAQPFTNHNGGGLGFNPTAAPGTADFGKLYYSTGDGGSGGDPRNLAESTANAFGKILRIDPLGRDAGRGYAVPTDARSPFATDADGASLGEIYAYGLRNPQRFSFDAADGKMLIGDIGQGVVEEVDVSRADQAGLNFGWNAREGSFEYVDGNTVRVNATPAGLTDPVAEYDHGENRRAVNGGVVYRGGGIPGLEGKYLFGDLNAGEVYFIDADALPDGGQSSIRNLVLIGDDGTMTTTLNDLVGGRSDVHFGLGGGGELLLLNKRDGTVRQLVAVPEPASLAAVGLIAAGLLGRRRR